jgi:glucosamine-6-phosphate deaminase
VNGVAGGRNVRCSGAPDESANLLTSNRETMRHALELLPVIIIDDRNDIARLVAGRIEALIRAQRAAGGKAVLGLATGATPIGVYRELIRLHLEQDLDFSDVVTFNLDEYYPMSPDSSHSYHRFMREHLFDHINIPQQNVHMPHGAVARRQVAAHCRAYEAAIERAGGIDFQILGIGRTGHIGFNEPGSGRDSRTRLVQLDTITRQDAAAYFFGEEAVPGEAITMGVATIMAAREIALIATGEHKARIVKRAAEGAVSRDVPATFLQGHRNTRFYVDAAAASELTRVRTPVRAGGSTLPPEFHEMAPFVVVGGEPQDAGAHVERAERAALTLAEM